MVPPGTRMVEKQSGPQSCTDVWSRDADEPGSVLTRNVRLAGEEQPSSGYLHPKMTPLKRPKAAARLMRGHLGLSPAPSLTCRTSVKCPFPGLGVPIYAMGRWCLCSVTPFCPVIMRFCGSQQGPGFPTNHFSFSYFYGEVCGP